MGAQAPGRDAGGNQGGHGVASEHFGDRSGTEDAGADAEKKSLCAAEQKRRKIKDERRRWRAGIAEVDPSRLVFIDESGAKTNMTRLRGRAPRGERVIDHVPAGHWHTTTMLAALRIDRVKAFLVIARSMDSLVFKGYVEQMLVKTLRPDDVVVMDNLSPHKCAGVQEAIEAVGASVRYLPPYSPDFTPIESMWSKVKQSFRSAAPRTPDELLTAIGNALRGVTAQDCRGLFNGYGYTATQ